MLRALDEKYAPELLVLFKSPARAEKLAEAAPFTAEIEARDGKAQFTLCSEGRCVRL